MLISCFKLCSAALILKTECVVISQWLSVCVCVFGTKGPARRVSGIPHFFTIGCVVFRILSGVRLKIIIFTSSGGAPHGSEPFSTYTHTHTLRQVDQQSIIFDCQNPFSGTAEFRSKISGSTVFYVGKETNYAERSWSLLIDKNITSGEVVRKQIKC